MKTKRRFSSVQRQDLLDKAQDCLWTEDGKVGLSYLKDERKLTEKTIRSFGLGYVPSFARHQLAGRIVFPLYDPSDNLIVISSRQVDKSNDFLPVYWHEAYEKSFYLYGIHVAKEWMRRWRFVVVTEGQFDVLQLHNHGMKNAVGLSGNSFTETQLAMIWRYCDEIVFVFDADVNQSGQKAAERLFGWINSLSGVRPSKIEEMQRTKSNALHYFSHKVGLVEFDEYTDPDKYIREHGMSALQVKIKNKVKEIRGNVN